MEQLFGYLNKSGLISITSRIGEFLKSYVGSDCRGGVIIQHPDILNDIDRIALAEEFCKKNYYGINGVINERHKIKSFTNEELLLDIAKQIDRLIPKRYFMLKQIEAGINKDVAKNRYTGIHQVPELKYQFNHLYTKDNKDIRHEFQNYIQYIDREIATYKQLTYLQNLGKEFGYILINEDKLKKWDASSLIGFLINDEKIDEELIKKYLQYDC